MKDFLTHIINSVARTSSFWPVCRVASSGFCDHRVSRLTAFCLDWQHRGCQQSSLTGDHDLYHVSAHHALQGKDASVHAADYEQVKLTLTTTDESCCCCKTQTDNNNNTKKIKIQNLSSAVLLLGATVVLAEVKQLLESSRKQRSFKSGFESRKRELQFNTAGGNKFQVRGAAVLNNCLANDVRGKGTSRRRSIVDNNVINSKVHLDDVLTIITNVIQ